MTLQSSPPLKLSEIKTEFSSVGQNNLRAYLGKGGAPGSGTLTILDFLGRSSSYLSTGWSDGWYESGWIYGAGGYSSTTTYDYYGMNSVSGANELGMPAHQPGSTPYTNGSYPFGAAGSGNSLYTGSATTSVVGIMDLLYTFHQNPGSTGDASYAIGSYLLINGNNTGSWWTSIIANGITKNRSAASNPTGTYNSGYGMTYWFWSSSTFGFDGSGTFSVAIS